MKKTIIGISLLVGITGLIVGLYLFYKKQMALIMGYCYKIANVNFNSIGVNNIDMDITMRFRNNSDFIIDVTGYSLDVSVNNNYVATVQSNYKQTIANKSVSNLTFNAKFNPAQFFGSADLLGLVVSATTDQENFIIEVKGSLSAQVNFINVSNIPIDIKTSLYSILNPVSDTSDEQCTI